MRKMISFVNFAGIASIWSVLIFVHCMVTFFIKTFGQI